MAISAFPFETQDTTETEFSQLFRELQDSGVADSADGTGLKVQAASGMSVNILAGSAFLRGFLVVSDATENRTVAAPSAQARKDRVIARLDPAANTVTFHVVPGMPGSATPIPLVQTSTGIYEIGLAVITVNPGDANVTAGAVADERQFVGSRTGAWSNATRPASPRKARLGLNVDSGLWEFWTGTAWANLIPATVDNATRWNGYTITVSTTTPGGTPTADRIWIQPTT